MNQVTQCRFNFDFEKCDNLINGWIPQSQYFMTVRFMILASLRRKIMVEESENSDLAAAEKRFELLQQIFGNKAGLIHGKMKEKQKKEMNTPTDNGDCLIF